MSEPKIEGKLKTDCRTEKSSRNVSPTFGQHQKSDELFSDFDDAQPVEKPSLQNLKTENLKHNRSLADKSVRNSLHRNQNPQKFTFEGRNRASYWSIFLFNYVNPLLDQSIFSKHDLNALGQLPDDLKVSFEIR